MQVFWCQMLICWIKRNFFDFTNISDITTKMESLYSVDKPASNQPHFLLLEHFFTMLVFLSMLFIPAPVRWSQLKNLWPVSCNNSVEHRASKLKLDSFNVAVHTGHARTICLKISKISVAWDNFCVHHSNTEQAIVRQHCWLSDAYGASWTDGLQCIALLGAFVAANYTFSDHIVHGASNVFILNTHIVFLTWSARDTSMVCCIMTSDVLQVMLRQ